MLCRYEEPRRRGRSFSATLQGRLRRRIDMASYIDMASLDLSV